MRKRGRRMKASDVSREHPPVFGRPVSFEEAYPDIDDLTIEVNESGEGIGRWGGFATYNKRGFPGEYVDCSNPRCFNGGFSLGRLLYPMIGRRQAESETSLPCQGYEGSPKGKRIYRKCLNGFTIKVLIQYKDADGNVA
ncbi:MAG: hypothetical protein IH860_01290 [Chloroflexi bacterium]|nr:hypothetical protein [Chloroflexota bacterium]